MAKGTIKVETVERVVKDEVATYILGMDKDELLTLSHMIDTYCHEHMLTHNTARIRDAVNSLLNKA